MKPTLTHIRIILALVICLLFTTSQAQQKWWTKKSLPTNKNQPHLVDHYARFALDHQAFQLALRSTPAEGSRVISSQPAIAIPMPNGKMVDFYFEETQLFISSDGTTTGVKTYTGYSKDRSAIIHLTVWANKVSALAIQGTYKWFISSSADTTVKEIEVYDTEGRPFDKLPPMYGPDAQFPTGPDSPRPTGDGTAQRNPSMPCALRIYRLAIAGTAEYTNYFGGQAAAIANTVALVNNLNALFEREVSVRFTLVTGNNLMYTDPATDPFNFPSTKCGELTLSRANFASVLGVANYDLGVTVYAENFGGCAYLASTCSNNNKGGAVGGYDIPTPTSYLLEVCAHEIGHLYSAGHTHNADNGTDCVHDPVSAWEPGGGSTIMAYSGCAPSYTNYNTGLYFHGGTLGQMRAYIASPNGACFTTGPTNRTPAIATLTDNTFFIPISTPFKLSAEASDTADNNTLTYTFEQMDVGTGSIAPPSPTTPAGPVIRSMEASPVNYRYIPKMDSLLINKVPVFESLPAIARNLTFWATVRDNHSGCGCTSVDTITVATSGATPFRVTSQAAPVTVNAGSSITVNWQVANTNLAPFNTPNVRILFAGDGLNYDIVLAASTPNDGSQQVTIPNIATTHARIMVAAEGNIFFDINHADMTVQLSCPAIQSTQVWPVEPVFGAPGDAALQLNLFPAYGQATDTLPGEISAASPSGHIAVGASSTDPTCASSFTGRYEVFRFQTAAPGNYTVTHTAHTLTGFRLFSLYDANGFDPANICTNYLLKSNAYRNGGSLVAGGSFTFTATANTIYTLPFMLNGNNAAQFGTYRMNIVGPGKIFKEFQNAGTGYAYIVVNSAGNIVLTSATPPDLRASAADTYYVYGVSHTTGFDLAAYQGQPLTNLLYATFSGGNCAAISNNRKQIVIASSAILPLTYVKLTARHTDAGNVLSWEVSDDEDVNGCEVEHSTNGVQFTAVAKLQKLENRTGNAQYSYRHTGAAAGKNYYRIRQYNMRGGFLYSNIATANGPGRSAITIAPNPTTGLVVITSTGQTAAPAFILKVYDNQGRLVRQALINRSSYTLDLSNLPAGIYTLIGDGFKEKLMKY